MKVDFMLNGAVVATATLDDNASAGDLALLLPLDLALEDYEATEKIARLPRPLTTDGVPAAHMPVAGDLCFYAPWGNLAVFYKDGQLSDGLVRLGRLERGWATAWLLDDPAVRLVVAAP